MIQCFGRGRARANLIHSFTNKGRSKDSTWEEATTNLFNNKRNKERKVKRRKKLQVGCFMTLKSLSYFKVYWDCGCTQIWFRLTFFPSFSLSLALAGWRRIIFNAPTIPPLCKRVKSHSLSLSSRPVWAKRWIQDRLGHWLVMLVHFSLSFPLNKFLFLSPLAKEGKENGKRNVHHSSFISFPLSF